MKAQQSNGDMSVRFTSNKKKEASGARCTIKCVKAAPGATTPAPTTANPGTNTTTGELEVIIILYHHLIIIIIVTIIVIHCHIP